MEIEELIENKGSNNDLKEELKEINKNIESMKEDMKNSETASSAKIEEKIKAILTTENLHKPVEVRNKDREPKSEQIQSNYNNNNEEPKTYKRKRLSIPYKGRVLKPTYKDLLECEGDLDEVTKRVESEPMEFHQKKWKISFFWKQNVLSPTPEELKLAKGNYD